MHVARGKAPARTQIGDQRRAGEHRGDIVEVEDDAGLVRDRRDVQCRVGRAAGGGDDRAGIFQRLAGDDVARTRAALCHRPHDDRPGAPREAGALGVGAGNHRHVRHAEAERLRHHRHCVGGELPRAGANRRQTGTFEPRQRRFVHRAGQHRADRLVGIEDCHVALAEPAGQRRTAIHEHRRHVAAHHAHHDARQGLVAAAKADEPVIGKPVHDRLDRVGD